MNNYDVVQPGDVIARLARVDREYREGTRQ